ncbi:hypothetical protein [Flavobacterium sp. GCM10027622]|uniref:hypothetical protein n=1 Tax=unclassified Flavobacterium TaxID=196869 RepID=UPI003614C6BD
MRKILFLLAVMGSVTVSAQKKDAIYKKLAEKTCDCSIKKGPNIGDMELGLCIFEAVGTLDEKEQKIMGINPNKKMESIEKIAEGVGIEMALTCPQVFKNMKDDEGKPLFEDGGASTFTASGVIEDVVANEFKTIKLKDESNMSRDFIWLTQFEGDSLLLKNKVAKGDKVEISFAEETFFDNKTNTYRVFYTIRGIKLL